VGNACELATKGAVRDTGLGSARGENAGIASMIDKEKKEEQKPLSPLISNWSLTLSSLITPPPSLFRGMGSHLSLFARAIPASHVTLLLSPPHPLIVALSSAADLQLFSQGVF
jgi:hypothetical protein